MSCISIDNFASFFSSLGSFTGITLFNSMPPYPCEINGIKLLCMTMESLVAANKNAFRHADWVSHIRIESGEVSRSNGVYDIRLFITHVEVFKKPQEIDELPTIIYGSSQLHVELEDGKEYLICGQLIAEKAYYCSIGQVKPHGAEYGSNVAMEWHQFSEVFIDEMKAFLQLIPEEFLYTY